MTKPGQWLNLLFNHKHCDTWHAGSEYRNYKGHESLVLMAVADSDHRWVCMKVHQVYRHGDRVLGSQLWEPRFESRSLWSPAVSVRHKHVQSITDCHWLQIHCALWLQWQNVRRRCVARLPALCGQRWPSTPLAPPRTPRRNEPRLGPSRLCLPINPLHTKTIQPS